MRKPLSGEVRVSNELKQTSPQDILASTIAKMFMAERVQLDPIATMTKFGEFLQGRPVLTDDYPQMSFGECVDVLSKQIEKMTDKEVFLLRDALKTLPPISQPKEAGRQGVDIGQAMAYAERMVRRDQLIVDAAIAIGRRLEQLDQK